jgi:hypothetical protein
MPREGEVVLIYYQDQPAVFARIEAIEPDVKKDWYQVTLLLLTLPTQVVTWILRESYINGAPFTMGGTPVRMENVEKVSIEKGAEDPYHREEKKAPEKPGRVIPFKKP